MSVFSFKVVKELGQARLGELHTPCGTIDTPAFVPVGTQATVKAVSIDDLQKLKIQVVLANTYHLYLRPGVETIECLGGLHKMMNWNGPMMTDSGGYQVFSLGWAIEHGVGKVVNFLADDSREEEELKRQITVKTKSIIPRQKLCVVDDEKATFISHVDGSLHVWTPEKSIEIQGKLGADLIFAMDECTSPIHDSDYTRNSMYRTHLWEERSLVKFRKLHNKFQEIYGVVQGGPFEDLRIESAKFVADNHFFGNGIGGAMVTKSKMLEVLDWIMSILPADRPSHLLGIGGIDDILNTVGYGIDTYDCAFPTRLARRGGLLMLPEDGGKLLNRWTLNVVREEFKNDNSPLSQNCECELCSGGYSKGYLHHLYWAKELLIFRLTTIHNLYVMEKLMSEIREGIAENKLEKVKRKWLG
ncbi:tRNA guanosine(34) transglycosylase Tgt [Candidatus Collierbacteria bacterium]|nr:tRNA guanosine(34) transglycosylase Tgt [Candidatus Collierbacteria bacterium]